jgi:putative restriction endonuclease
VASMKYWWVNHKQTARQEISGGYLWSPKTEANGARSQFYDNMREAAPGDVVVSYANGLVGHAGIVTEFAVTAPMPSSFGTGTYWRGEGWLLPVSWSQLEPKVPPKTILRQIAPLLPTKYSPLRPETGDGNQKAYLAEIDERLFSLVAGLGGVTAEQLGANASGGPDVIAVLEDAAQRQIEEDAGLTDTQKEQLVLARKGQGLFRSRVIELEPRCRLTGVDTPVLLIASHIKPWRACSTATERLDGENGLMLTPHVDRLFDKGLISFTDSGGVLMSPKLDRADIGRLGLGEACSKSVGRFSDGQAHYLKHHRDVVFVRSSG